MNDWLAIGALIALVALAFGGFISWAWGQGIIWGI